MITNRLENNWEFFRGTLGGIWEVWREDILSNHFNVPWSKVTVPHCYNAEDAVDPDKTYYQGPAWYRNKIKVNNPYFKGRTLLNFEGAGQKTELYIFKKKISSHTGGYDEFTVDITDSINDFKNSEMFKEYKTKIPLAIRCDNSRDLEMIPSDTSDFNLYGGIYRNINLVYLPAISIKNLKINPLINSNVAQIDVDFDLYNPESIFEKIEIKIEILNKNNKIVFKDKISSDSKKQKENFNFEISNPDLWSPANPNLYSCQIEIISELGNSKINKNFGIRSFEFLTKGPFKLNGKRLLLKGTHRHEDHAGVGAAMTHDIIEEELKMIKDMGVNFIRLAHYQQSKFVLELCDKLGILVWEEIPWCRGGLGGEKYKNQARQMLKNMINQHYNHPSIIIWGLGNENDWEADFDYFSKDKIREFMSELNDISHNLDPDRVTAIRRCDFCKDIVDLYSPSIWAGWYGGIYKDYKQATKDEFNKVDKFIHVEWGADNLAGRHVEKVYTGFEEIENRKTAEEDGDFFLKGGKARVSKDGDWSEDYFCDLIDWHLKEQESMDWLTGTAQWPFKDFSTPVRPNNPIPYMNLKGVVERNLKKKEAYYVFQSYWTTKPMAHIYGHNSGVRWGNIAEKKLVKVYSNCNEAELFLNGKSCGVKYRDSSNFPAAGLRWEVNFIPGQNKLKVVANKNNEKVIDEIELFYQINNWGNAVKLKITDKKTDNKLKFIEVKAYDENDIFCADADFFVKFKYAGDGRILDNLGTVNGSNYVQLATGKAGIWVDPGYLSIISVSSNYTDTVSIKIKGAKT